MRSEDNNCSSEPDLLKDIEERVIRMKEDLKETEEEITVLRMLLEK